VDSRQKFLRVMRWAPISIFLLLLLFGERLTMPQFLLGLGVAFLISILSFGLGFSRPRDR
jgi:hypothetical protein